MGSITESNVSPAGVDIQGASLSHILADVTSRYTLNHRRSKESHEEACKYMPGGNTRTVLHVAPFPLTVQSGESCNLTTVDDITLIDFVGEYTAGIYGHNNPVIRKAVEQALDGGWNYGAHNQMEQNLAKTICKRFPAMELVRFVNSGTEANMMALATATAYTGRKRVLLFYGGYHGSTISGRFSSERVSINLPHHFVLGRYNDTSGTQDLIDSVKDDLAAILVEPMMGSGGCFQAKPEFLKLLRDCATRTGALLIFDEVMTSRLGYHGLGHAQGITPDLMTIGKWVGGGMTFGAFGGRQDLMAMYDPRVGTLDHPGTFNNNIVTMNAGIAGCELLTEKRLAELNALGNSMRASLQTLFKRYQFNGRIPNAPLLDEQQSVGFPNHPPKMFITGVGSMMTIHFGGPHRIQLQSLFYLHMVESGFYVTPKGFISLNIELNQSHVDKYVRAVDDFCQQMQDFLRW